MGYQIAPTVTASVQYITNIFWTAASHFQWSVSWSDESAAVSITRSTATAGVNPVC